MERRPTKVRERECEGRMERERGGEGGREGCRKPERSRK